MLLNERRDRWTSGWTGGQYSVFRALLGSYLLVHYALLIPWGAELFSSSGMLADGSVGPLLHAFPNVLALEDAPEFVTALLLAGVGLSALLVVGWGDHAAAVGLWYLGACLLGRNPLTSNPALPFVGWLLLAHALLPRAPFGSLAARGRADPGGAWRMPGAVFAAAWIVMAVGYSYSGFAKLASPSWLDGSAIAHVLGNPLARDTALRVWLLELPEPLLRLATWSGLGLELCFAPLALSRRLRPWLWLALVGMHVSLLALVDFADLTLGMLMLHAFTFDPAWILPERSRRAGEAPETVVYDGECGLCHGFVRFVLAEDAGAFRFTPRSAVLAESELEEPLPDSLLVLRADGTTLARAAAVRHVLARLGGVWRVAATLGRAVPAGLADRAYDAVARVRRRLGPAPAAACPLLPPALRERFVLERSS